MTAHLRKMESIKNKAEVALAALKLNHDQADDNDDDDDSTDATLVKERNLRQALGELILTIRRTSSQASGPSLSEEAEAIRSWLMQYEVCRHGHSRCSKEEK